MTYERQPHRHFADAMEVSWETWNSYSSLKLDGTEAASGYPRQRNSTSFSRRKGTGESGKEFLSSDRIR